MNRIIKTVYAIVLICAILVTVSIFVEYRLFNAVLRDELKKSLELERELVALSVESALMTHAQTVEDAADFMTVSEDEEVIRDYFESLLNANPVFSSVYFLSKDNEMINGSGWVPPEGLDLRDRPWYVDAMENGDVIFTEAFLNASKDELIVTVAVPVKGISGENIGVVAGDMAIADIIGLVPSPGAFEESFSFMTDGNGQILAYPQISYDPSAGLKELEDVSLELAGMLAKNSSGLYEIEMGGVPGYVAFKVVGGTEWKVGSFIRTAGNLIPEQKLLPMYLAVLLTVLLMLVAIFFWQRTLIVDPIRALDRDIQAVSPGTDLDHRLPEDPKDPFLLLRKAVNKVLDKTSESFSKMQMTNEKMKDKNHELSAAMLQLRTVESELRKQYESLYLSRAELKVSEEMNRAIVTALPDKIVRVDSGGRVFDCNLNGHDPDTAPDSIVAAKYLKDIMPEDAVENAMIRISEVIRSRKPGSFDYQAVNGGRKEYFEVRLVNIRSNEVIAIIRDVTDQRNNLNFIEFLSYNDQLSGLHNRRYFDEKLPMTDVPSNLPISVLMLDLNALKMTNDAFGHHMGDQVIREMADILRSNCRESDMLVRSGGDEFIVVMPQTDSKAASVITERILSDAASRNANGMQVSVSGGYCTKENEDQDFQDIMLKAEVELYRNKLVESPVMKNKMTDDIIGILSNRDPKNIRHFDNVSDVSRKIGESMGLPETMLDAIQEAGFLHDIGKIAVIADHLLDESEFDDESSPGYHKHPETGYQILRSVDKYLPLAEYVLYHHEKWDGSGFPRGLKDEEIPLVSRIIAVAEFYDACISGRSNLTACSKAEAIDKLATSSGRKYDPAVVRALQSISDNI